jgi:hypothetical protein
MPFLPGPATMGGLAAHPARDPPRPGRRDRSLNLGKEWHTMDYLLNGVNNPGFIPWIWVFLSFTILHELEEWSINVFERRYFSGVPDYATDRSARGVIALISAVGAIWSVIAALTGDPTAAAWIFLPAVFFMVTNALQHVYWSVRFRRYPPGIVSAVGLILPCGLWMILHAVGKGYVPAVYAGGLTVLAAAASIHTVRDGSRMSPFVRGAYAIGHWIAERIP